MKPTSDHKYNPEDRGRLFNEYELPQSFNDADEASRKCQERIDTLIETTKRDLQEGR